jgi:hypothetical protein
MLITASLEGAVVLCRTRRSPEPLLAIAEEIKLLIERAKKQV